MNALIDKLYRRLLKFMLDRSCSERVPRSGEAGEQVNCFSVRIDENGQPYFWARSMEGATLRGKRWDGHSFAIDFELNYAGINPASVDIRHYYGLNEVAYKGIRDVAWTWAFPGIYLKIHIHRVLDRIAQYFFNKRSLESIERHRLLSLLIDTHSENGRPVSSIDVMTQINTLRWVLHPDRDAQQKRIELYLDSLVDTGELAKQGHRYTVTGRAIGTIERFKEEERRHRENARIQYGVLIVTAAMAVTAWQSNKLSQRVALASEEPILEVSVINNGPDAALAYELFNGSSFALDNVTVTDYLYSANRRIEFSSAYPIGGQPTIPQFNIDHIKPSERKRLSTTRTIPSAKFISELRTGKQIPVLHLDLSFRHAITHRQYDRSDRYIILPSSMGWTITKVTNGLVWALDKFEKTR